MAKSYSKHSYTEINRRHDLLPNDWRSSKTHTYKYSTGIRNQIFDDEPFAAFFFPPSAFTRVAYSGSGAKKINHKKKNVAISIRRCIHHAYVDRVLVSRSDWMTRSASSRRIWANSTTSSTGWTVWSRPWTDWNLKWSVSTFSARTRNGPSENSTWVLRCSTRITLLYCYGFYFWNTFKKIFVLMAYSILS